MQCINFDRQFEAYAKKWMQDNTARYHNDLDQMEAQMPDVYLRWLNQSAAWLGGSTPGAYFDQFDDPTMLCDWMIQYFLQSAPVPDQLLERIVQLETAAESVLLSHLEAAATPYEARLTIVSMLRELCSHAPMAQYIRWIAKRDVHDELADMTAESLVNMGRCVVSQVLSAVETANEAGEETFLDILCNFPGDDRIFSLAMRLFEKHTARRALFASYLGKLGDVRAIPALEQAARVEDINYLDYIELRNAIEELGGELPAEREFIGDQYYESLRRMRC